MQILPESAKDSIVPLTVQCEQIESNIVQLRRERKRRRVAGKRERDAKKDAMIRKLRDELSESRLRGFLRKVVSPFWRYFAGFEKDCWWASPRARWDLRRAKTSQCILFLAWGAQTCSFFTCTVLVISIVATGTNS